MTKAEVASDFVAWLRERDVLLCTTTDAGVGRHGRMRPVDEPPGYDTDELIQEWSSGFSIQPQFSGSPVAQHDHGSG